MKLKSLYPIHAAAMNKVSDVTLAVAVHDAGCIPSISIFNYIQDFKINYDLLQKDLLTFIKKTNSSQIVLSIGSSHLSSNILHNIVKQTAITHIEIIIENFSMSDIVFDYDNHKIFENVSSDIVRYQNLGVGIILKSLTKWMVLEAERYYYRTFDYYMLKGPDSAGTIIDRKKGTLLDEVKEIKEMFPEVNLIVAGGIGTGEDAKSYLDAGADIIALGTLFAMCKESCIDITTKEKIIQSKKITQFTDIKQNAFIIDSYNGEDDMNHTNSLKSGVDGNSTGHVFVGKGLKDISSVVTVKNMIQNFVRSM